MTYRVLGHIGGKVSAIGLGGWHLALKHVDEPLAIRIVRAAIDGGITFMDNCWDYNDGASEIRMDQWNQGTLRPYGQKPPRGSLPVAAVHSGSWKARARKRKSTMLPSCGWSQLSLIVGIGPMFRRSM
jgi:predicted aldo/keto reductase-like oxidoreductase